MDAAGTRVKQAWGLAAHRGVGVAGDGIEPLFHCLLCLEQLLVPRVQLSQPRLCLLQRL